MKLTQRAKTMNNKPLPISHSAIELHIAQERLRQARYSFNLALVATTASFLVSLTGAGLLLSNQITEGSVIAAGGLVSSVHCIQLAKDTNDRLDKILPELDEDAHSQ